MRHRKRCPMHLISLLFTLYDSRCMQSLGWSSSITVSMHTYNGPGGPSQRTSSGSAADELSWGFEFGLNSGLRGFGFGCGVAGGVAHQTARRPRRPGRRRAWWWRAGVGPRSSLAVVECAVISLTSPVHCPHRRQRGNCSLPFQSFQSSRQREYSAVHPLSIRIQTPTARSGGCSRMTVSPTASPAAGHAVGVDGTADARGPTVAYGGRTRQ